MTTVQKIFDNDLEVTISRSPIFGGVIIKASNDKYANRLVIPIVEIEKVNTDIISVVVDRLVDDIDRKENE